MTNCEDLNFRRGEIRGIRRSIASLQDMMSLFDRGAMVDWHAAILDCINRLREKDLVDTAEEAISQIDGRCPGGRYVPAAARPMAPWGWEDCECSRPQERRERKTREE